MWTVSKAEVADLLKLNLLARLREVQEKEELFEQEHEQSFRAFEEAALHGSEDFAQWDDYVEWKAYRKVAQDLKAKIRALRHGDFEVA